MIKTYKIENTETTYTRIWQKVNFGKEILEPKFFDNTDVTDSRNSIRFSIYQLNPTTRLFYSENKLYSITNDEPIYNYLDTGRAVSIYQKDRYSSYSRLTFYIYNDLIITDKDIVDFEDYRDKDNLNLKLISDTDIGIVYLVFKEDLDKIKSRLAEIRAEEERIKKDEVKETISKTQE
jgi:hypothetical protein